MTHSKLNTFIFVGLGNPGQQYEKTRHNIGFSVIKALGRRVGSHFKEDKHFNAYVAKGVIEDTSIHLLMPMTYMNLSGIAIRRYLDFYKLNVSQLVVIVDDIALPFGHLRFKLKGSSGGHNGLKSVEAYLGTTHFMRLRMGIGDPCEHVLKDYVLAPFSREELEKLEPFVDLGADVLQQLLKTSPFRVMNQVNRKAPEIKGNNKTPNGLGENTHESSK